MTSVDVNTERQVRAVLESLQTQSPKQAFNVCEKYLRKNPGSAQLLAVKALLLVYQGKDLEGIALAKEVAGRKPSDITTLGNLDKVFVTANEYKASTAMFEDAFKGIPTEDIGSLWYFSVLRTQDAKALFAIALKLHSMFKGPSQTYLFWAIIALHLQMASPEAKDEPEEKGKAMRLAEKMIIRAFAPERIQDRSLDELLLLIITLQATENYQEALRVLDEAAGIKFPNSDERSIIRAELLEKSGDAAGAAAFLQDLLRDKGIFDWGAWKLYVKVIGSCAGEGATASLTAELPEFLRSIKAQTDARSYLLAWVDAGIIFQAKFCSGEDLLGHIGAYIEAFKDRACCLPDVQHICQSLEVPLARQLAESAGGHPIESLDDLRKNFTQFRCSRLFRLRCQEGQEAQQIAAAADISRLTASLATGKTVEEGDRELFSLVHLHLATLHVDTFDADAGRGGEQRTMPLLHALNHAHQALLHAPENFAIKLLLIMLYLHLGNMTAPLALFRSLNIKQLQLDTLAFLISDHILELGDVQHAETFFHESFYIYDENRMSSWSLIAETLSRRSYANAPEFYEFARRLEYSMQAVACICGTIKTEMITKNVEEISTYLAGLKAEELIFDAKFIKNLSDNRDRDVLEFADHGGSVRRKLLDTLPTFGQVSMLSYTFLPIFFRSLLAHDLEGLRHLLQEKFPDSLALINAEHASRRERQILEFVQKLFAAAATWLCRESSKEPDYAGFSSALADLIVESGLAAGGEEGAAAEAMMPSYNFFSDTWGRVELYRWCVLTLVFTVRGEATGMLGGSGKARKSQKARFQPAIDLLEAIAAAALAKLRATADELPIVPPTASEIASEAWEELLAAWKKSLKSYETIYKDTVALLRALR